MNLLSVGLFQQQKEAKLNGHENHLSFASFNTASQFPMELFQKRTDSMHHFVGESATSGVVTCS